MQSGPMQLWVVFQLRHALHALQEMVHDTRYFRVMVVDVQLSGSQRGNISYIFDIYGFFR